MNNTKTLTTVILVALMVFGLMSLLLVDNDAWKEEYEAAITLAEDYESRGLYQLTIDEYEKAIALQDSQELRDAVLAAYEKRYEESDDMIEDYITAAQEAVAAFPDEAKYHAILARTHQKNADYKSAYKVLVNAKQSITDSKEIEDLFLEIKYTFEIMWGEYESFLPCVSGFYPVKKEGKWGLMDDTGANSGEFNHTYVSRVGEEGIRILCSEEQNVLEDQDGNMRGKLSFTPTEAGVLSEGLIAIKKGNEYGFYDSLGDHKFGKYVAAGSFTNGKVAVSEKEGQWYLIDKEGNKVSESGYQDIKLNLDGSYFKNGIMLAKNKDKYKIYNQDEEQVGEFQCDNIDVVTDDGIIAFEEKGKWGFVDTSGKVVIEPKYDKAKSFSNNLAAVCMNEVWGFIDKNGRIVIECQFLDADYFTGKNTCLVKTAQVHWQMIRFFVEF